MYLPLPLELHPRAGDGHAADAVVIVHHAIEAEVHERLEAHNRVLHLAVTRVVKVGDQLKRGKLKHSDISVRLYCHS